MENLADTTAAPEAPIAHAPPAAPRASSMPLQQMQREEEADLKNWIDSLAGESPVKVVVRRKRPLVGADGSNIGGILETVEDRVDEEYLRDMWGGGDFMLQIQTQQRDGKFKYLKARTLSLAGPPKMHGVVVGKSDAAPVIAADDNSLAERAFGAMNQLAKEERARADRLLDQASKHNGVDVAALQMLNAPLIEQLRAAQETIAQLQTQLITQTTRPPPRDEFRDRLLERAIGDENKAIEMLRTTYEARIEKLRDNFDDERKRAEDRHHDEMKRLEARHSDEMRRMETAHEREIRALEKQTETSSKNLDVANTTRIEALKDEKARIERELAAAQTRIATLEAKKDQSISEKADELIKVKEALEGLGGGDDEDKSWYEKVIDGVANSEAAINLINKIGGGPGDQQQGQQMQLPPPGTPFQGPDGQIYVQHPNGQVMLVDPNALRQRRALAAARARRQQQRAAGGAAPAAPGQPEPQQEAAPSAPGRRPKAAEVKLAVKFMENALNSPGTTPETFARGARNLVPSDVLSFIQRVGIDNFLNQVVEPGSPLTTIRGRQFARAVAQILLHGEATPAQAAPDPANDEADGDPGDDAEGDDELDEGDEDDLGGEGDPG